MGKANGRPRDIEGHAAASVTAANEAKYNFDLAQEYGIRSGPSGAMDFANQSELINRLLNQKTVARQERQSQFSEGAECNSRKRKVVMYGKYKRYGKSKRAYHGKKRRGRGSENTDQVAVESACRSRASYEAPLIMTCTHPIKMGTEWSCLAASVWRAE